MAKTIKVDAKNIEKMLEFFYKDEINDFVEILEDEDVIEEDEMPIKLEEAISFCEKRNLTNHVAFNLMILKRDLGHKSTFELC